MAHTFIMLFVLELHCLGSEVLQQIGMLGEWRWIPDLSSLKAPTKPADWSYHNCPYPRGSVVRCKGRYYEAMAVLNTSTPSCSSRCIYPVAFILGDSQRTKLLVMIALLILNATLVRLIILSNHWSMYAVMLVPNCCQFLYVKYRHSHAFFNPAHLNLWQVQNASNAGVPQASESAGTHCSQGTSMNNSQNSSQVTRTHNCYSTNSKSYITDNDEDGDILPDVGGGKANLSDILADSGVVACLHCPNPLFMSAVSASTVFFFGPSGTTRSSPGFGSSGLLKHETPVRNGM